MICAGRPEYVTSFPNCGEPQNVSQAFPLDYERPTFAIGVAWPNAKDYRYEMQWVMIRGSRSEAPDWRGLLLAWVPEGQ